MSTMHYNSMIAVSVDMASRTAVHKRNFLLIIEHLTLPPSVRRFSELKCDRPEHTGL